MHAIGLDIGTTSVSALVLDISSGEVLKSISAANDSNVKGKPYESLQDANRILDIATDMLDKLMVTYKDIKAVGITGQMHGILYVDGSGNAISPLYSWQDGRGSQHLSEGKEYTETLKELTGCSFLASGYGIVTHFSNMKMGVVPKNAATFCTIGDFVAMRITGKTTPLIHPSNAASLGLYDIDKNDFDYQMLSSAGIDVSLLPKVTRGLTTAGETKNSIPVAVSIGDNQAGFLGSMQDMRNSILLNIGTGGQISVASDVPLLSSPLIETRPLLGDGSFILVGAAICGGSSYAMLEQFFQSFLGEFELRDYDVYKKMESLAFRYLENRNEPLCVSTLFRGTRQNASLRGSIKKISADNLTPMHLVGGFLEGMAQEYLNLLQCMDIRNNRIFTKLIGSGNGIRKNRPLQVIMEHCFGSQMQITKFSEEAAYGAALYALTSAGVFSDIKQAQKLIKYTGDFHKPL
jgi:sedoheptulokinase